MKTLPRILIADPHPIARRGVLEALAGVANCVAETGDGREALALSRTTRPDVAFLAVNLTGLNGIEVAQRLIHQRPQLAVVMLTVHEETEVVFRALNAGALSYVLKSSPVEELRAALGKTLAGETYVCQLLSDKLRHLGPLAQIAATKTTLEILTARQREIIQLIAEGHATKAIALILSVSSKTVEYHRMRVMQKLNIFDVPGLVRWAVRSQLVSP